MNLEQAVKEEWYSQSFNLKPVFLGSAFECNEYASEYTGVTYHDYLMTCKNNYGGMSYCNSDLNRVGNLIRKKVEENPNYLAQLKTKYDQDIQENNQHYSQIDGIDIDTITIEETKKLVETALRCLVLSMGVAHVIEPFALTADFKIKNDLGKYIQSAKELNDMFVVLTSPTKTSFASEYETLIFAIATSHDNSVKEKLAQKIVQNFYWIRNGYAGRYALTLNEVLKEAASLDQSKYNNQARPKIDKPDRQQIINKLNLPQKLINELNVLSFLTDWQDERKKNILIAVDYLDRLIDKLAKKINIPSNLMYLMIPSEIREEKYQSKNFIEELKQRADGVVFLYSFPKEPIIATGKVFTEFMKDMQKEIVEQVQEIYGMTASSGYAVGKVIVCTDIDSIHKVQEGDILVASMTRPEYLPAMKKASAIITDEGGITCHAAIISRELGIPCIIGTKIATQVLKDGMTVEVKANHGVVKIIQ
ncbi:MAG: PEP-utilizing enzyme [Patescibacteria group bacterium]|jgi:phosphohistidine swiveling domain-containing protein